MSNGMMYAQMGMAAISAFSSYSAVKHQGKMREIQQKYHNKMVAISQASELNTLTENELQTRDAFKRAEVAILGDALRSEADAELNAAVAGVRGKSVEATQTGLARSKLTAQFTLQRKRKAQMILHDEQFKSIKLQAIRSRDTAIIPKPSITAAVAGLGMNLIDIYDQHAAPGQASTDKLSRLGS